MALLAERVPWLLAAFAFAFGACIGSFLNVVIARLPKGESLVRPESHCPKCQTPIRWHDNIPVFGWLALRGKCRDCGLPISPRYPMVELLVGLLAVGCLRRFGPHGVAFAYFAFVAALVALAYIDLDTWLLPHEITFPLLALGALSPLWNPQLRWTDSLIGGAAGVVLFAAIALFGERVLKREIMGWGDVWLLGGIGAWMGWVSLLPVVMLSALQGAVVGVALLATGKGPAERDRKKAQEAAAEAPAPDPAAPPGEEDDDDWVPPPHAVPYGPFLVLAALEWLFAGEWLRYQYDRVLNQVFR